MEKKIGVIVGSGTGKELSNVFTNTLTNILDIVGKGEEAHIVKCDYEFGTYYKLRKLPYRKIEEKVQEEVEILKKFYKDFYSSGGRVIFRTAINAETLYLFRRIGKAVKVVNLPIGKKRILMIRDETQGFYGNNEYVIEDDVVRFSGKFTKENLSMVINFAVNVAKKEFKKTFDIWVVYKHHLFANIIEKWVNNILPNTKVYQPNHAVEMLFESPPQNDLLLITGNEVGDIFHEMFIFHWSIGNRKTLYSKNVYLSPELNGLIEYQTVHGSADDIAGKNIVNPTATLKIVGKIIETEFGVENFSLIMEDSIRYANQKLSVSSRTMNTDDFVNHVYSFIYKQYGGNNR